MKNIRVPVLVGLAAVIGLVVVLAPLTSSAPDGLERVAVDKGLATDEKAHALENSPLSGYRVRGVENEKLSLVLSGVIGVLITFVLGVGALGLLRRSASTTTNAEEGSP